MRLLDLFCGAGGAAMGYQRAGFEITGVDHEPQPNYPFEFIRADALRYLELLLETERWGVINPEAANACGYLLSAFDASPPCQKFSRMNRAVRAKHPDLVAPVRRLLEAAGRPYAIENVEGAPLRWPVLLCGTMFGLRVRRHRLFELSVPACELLPDCDCRLGVVSGRLIGHRVAGKVAPGRTQPPPRKESERRSAIGVEWMSTMEARQAVPPAYTEWVRRQLLAALENAA